MSKAAIFFCVHRHKARRTAIGHISLIKKTPTGFKAPTKQMHESPDLRGFRASEAFFCFEILKLARRLQYPSQVIRFTTRFGGLGTGRPGIPLFTPGSNRNAANPPFWDPWYRQAGGSLFTPDRRSQRSPPRFGNPGTGRPGIPAFIAPGDGSPAASGHRPCSRPIPLAAAAPPALSTTAHRHSLAYASSHPCH